MQDDTLVTGDIGWILDSLNSDRYDSSITATCIRNPGREMIFLAMVGSSLVIDIKKYHSATHGYRILRSCLGFLSTLPALAQRPP